MVRESSILVVGGGISGLTTAIEAAETGYDVFIVEREAYLGGRVAQMARYFPKLCPPSCGLEINFQRIRNNPRIRWFTLAEVEHVSGQPGEFQVAVRLNPRYVQLDRCTACGECVPVCPVERPNDFNYGMDKTKAIYLSHGMALPMKYVIDEQACLGADCSKCVKACRYGAINLSMEPKTIHLSVGAIVLATGWKAYGGTSLTDLGFGKHPNVISNVMMERLAAPNGPTRGRILRPSDGREARRVAFVQCAGSRDLNHLPYCSSICCLVSLKQATYVRERYPDSQAYIFYIDIRTPGTYEDFYRRVQNGGGVTFIKGKVGRVEEDAETGDIVVSAENLLSGEKVRLQVDLLVLALGMVPEAKELRIPGLDIAHDEYGFVVADRRTGVYAAGVAKRPADVASSVRDATGAALKATHPTAKE